LGGAAAALGVSAPPVGEYCPLVGVPPSATTVCDKPKRRQVHGEITETATNQKVNIFATQYERVKE